MDNIQLGEIVFCDITYQWERKFRNRIKTETKKLYNVVFGIEYDDTYPHLDYITHRRDIHKIKGYTEVQRNEQIRDKITGAYI